MWTASESCVWEKWQALAIILFFSYGFSDSALIPKLITADVIIAIVVDVKSKCAAWKTSLQIEKMQQLMEI